jgi:hypothetical protein
MKALHQVGRLFTVIRIVTPNRADQEPQSLEHHLDLIPTHHVGHLALVKNVVDHLRAPDLFREERTRLKN